MPEQETMSYMAGVVGPIKNGHVLDNLSLLLQFSRGTVCTGLQSNGLKCTKLHGTLARKDHLQLVCENHRYK